MRYLSLRQGLVGAWCPSLGATGYRLLDRSGYGNHGTLNNMDAGTDWVGDAYGAALDFDGVNDHIAIPPSANFQTIGGTTWTISAWVKVKAANSPGPIYPASTIICRGIIGSAQRDYILYYDGDSGNSRFSLQNSQGSDFPTLNSSIGSALIGVNYHVAGVCGSSGSAILYINGSVAATGTLRADVPVNNARIVTLGAAFDVNVQYFLNGQINDARVYNRVLTPAEIRLLASEPGIGLKPERVSVYFGESLSSRRRKILTGLT